MVAAADAIADDVRAGRVLRLEEELDHYHLATPPYYDTGGRLGSASILVWGTDEQKAKLPKKKGKKKKKKKKKKDA